MSSVDGLGGGAAGLAAAGRCRSSRRACRGSPRGCRPPRARSSARVCTMLISSPTNFLANDGMPSAACTWSMDHLERPGGGVARDRDGLAQHPLVVADLLPERGVGQHRGHLGERGVVRQVVGESLRHGAHHGRAAPEVAIGVRAAAVRRYGPSMTESFVSFGEQGAQLTYGSYLRLPAAARLPAPRVRPAGARRAALHHHPPGLRALVQAAAARGGGRAGRDERRHRRAHASGGPSTCSRGSTSSSGSWSSRSTCSRR